MMVGTVELGSGRRGVGWIAGAALAIGCSPDSVEVGVVDEAGEAGEDDDTAGTSGADGPATASDPSADDDAADDDVDDTAADEVAEAGDTAASAEDSSTDDAGSTDTGGGACVFEARPACEVEACLQSWVFGCEACGDEPDLATCFSVAEDCAYPWLDCAALPDSPCGRVWAMGSGAVEEFEDENAAVCVLEALRDGVPGRYELLWGMMGDDGLPVSEVHVGADGSAVMQWYYDCSGCSGFGRSGRSGTLALQPTTYFDDCLVAPTTESLAQCLFGFVDFEAPEEWTPAFTTGECTELVFECPPA